MFTDVVMHTCNHGASLTDGFSFRIDTTSILDHRFLRETMRTIKNVSAYPSSGSLPKKLVQVSPPDLKSRDNQYRGACGIKCMTYPQIPIVDPRPVRCNSHRSSLAWRQTCASSCPSSCHSRATCSKSFAGSFGFVSPHGFPVDCLSEFQNITTILRRRRHPTCRRRHRRNPSRIVRPRTRWTCPLVSRSPFQGIRSRLRRSKEVRVPGLEASR